jgi:hypothetical protein
MLAKAFFSPFLEKSIHQPAIPITTLIKLYHTNYSAARPPPHHVLLQFAMVTQQDMDRMPVYLWRRVFFANNHSRAIDTAEIGIEITRRCLAGQLSTTNKSLFFWTSGHHGFAGLAFAACKE